MTVVVEMAGIEPASEEVDQGSTTSLAGSLLLTHGPLSRQSEPCASRRLLDDPYRRRGYRTLAQRRPSPIRQREIGVDVAALRRLKRVEARRVLLSCPGLTRVGHLGCNP